MKLLTWNIQAAIGTRRYRDYVLKAHRQLLHTASKGAILASIAAEIAPHDVVCLQEVDLGGRRSGYRSQVEDIARLSGHAHIAVQENRTIPGISRHGNAMLSHFPLDVVEDLKLPGRLAGRGCLIADVRAEKDLRIACLHLSLGQADQTLQLSAIARQVREPRPWAVMGDFNCGGRSGPISAFCEITGGDLPAITPPTFPAWKPRRDFDHIITGGGVALEHYGTEPANFSDHLPVAARISF